MHHILLKADLWITLLAKRIVLGLRGASWWLQLVHQKRQSKGKCLRREQYIKIKIGVSNIRMKNFETSLLSFVPMAKNFLDNTWVVRSSSEDTSGSSLNFFSGYTNIVDIRLKYN